MKKLTKEQNIALQLKTQKAIEKGNAAFKKLTKPEKRVAIAKDVIAQVEAKVYKAKPGTYMQVLLKNNEGLSDKKDLQEVACDIANIRSCKVCAMGSLLMSKARKGDKVPLNSYKEVSWSDNDLGADNYDIIRDMDSIFSEKQLRLIEAVFEGEYVDYLDSCKRLTDSQQAFYNKHYNDNKRLIAIMKNIIANNGTFKL